MILIILFILLLLIIVIITIDNIFTQSKHYSKNLNENYNYKIYDQSQYKNEIIEKQQTKIQNNDLQNYIAKKTIMTKTEIKFYIELKKITDELNMTIFPQVDLERIIKVIDNNYRDRNRIKSRNIDYTIVENINYKIICCIELDDYSHNTERAKKTDNFKNELFQKVGIPLHRIKVNNNYDIEKIKTILQQDIIMY